MIDKPLYENPLAGGGSDQLQGDALVKQIEMRIAQRDVKSPAFNAFASEVMKTKGYPTKTIQEYNTLFPGTTSQQVSLLDAGSNANPANSIIGNGIYDMNTSGMRSPGAPGTSRFNATPPSVPVSEQTPIPGIIGDPFKPKSEDPLMQGYYDSDF